MRKILVIDDDERLAFLIEELLKQNGFNTESALSSSQARAMLNESHFDAVIVDWMMPNETGIDFIKSLRSSTSHLRNLPAIMLTAVDSMDGKITGFESGFDDYITKPFENRELVARLNALIKRSTYNESEISVLRFGECQFNPITGELKRNSELVYLSTTEIDLLTTLCQRPNQPFSRIDLAKKLSFQVSDRTIDVQITRLRKKIGDNPKAPRIIKTIRHIGYALCCDLT